MGPHEVYFLGVTKSLEFGYRGSLWVSIWLVVTQQQEAYSKPGLVNLIYALYSLVSILRLPTMIVMLCKSILQSKMGRARYLVVSHVSAVIRKKLERRECIELRPNRAAEFNM